MTSSQRCVLFDCSDNTKNIRVIRGNTYLANAIPCAQKGILVSLIVTSRISNVGSALLRTTHDDE
jgi:hypothetical protein